MTKHWAVQDAKAKFSALLRAAEKEPQTITYRGEPRYELRVKENHSEQTAALNGPPRWWVEAPKVAGFKLPLRRGRMRKVDL